MNSAKELLKTPAIGRDAKKLYILRRRMPKSGILRMDVNEVGAAYKNVSDMKGSGRLYKMFSRVRLRKMDFLHKENGESNFHNLPICNRKGILYEPSKNNPHVYNKMYFHPRGGGNNSLFTKYSI